MGMGSISKERINLSLQCDTTLLEPVQMLVLKQVARSCKAPKDKSHGFCRATPHPNPHPALSGSSRYNTIVPAGVDLGLLDFSTGLGYSRFSTFVLSLCLLRGAQTLLVLMAIMVCVLHNTELE